MVHEFTLHFVVQFLFFTVLNIQHLLHTFVVIVVVLTHFFLCVRCVSLTFGMLLVPEDLCVICDGMWMPDSVPNSQALSGQCSLQCHPKKKPGTWGQLSLLPIAFYSSDLLSPPLLSL